MVKERDTRKLECIIGIHDWWYFNKSGHKVKEITFTKDFPYTVKCIDCGKGKNEYS